MTQIFDEDVQIKEDTPGLQYNGLEPGAIWHEDRELDGIMYRATNAQYNLNDDGLWTQPDTTKPSYCMAQNTDGSISYLYMPKNQTSGGWGATAWQSTDVQEFYAVNYGLIANDMTAAAGNSGALLAAVKAALTNGGGILRLPAGSFYLDGPIVVDFTDSSLPSPANGLVIAGFSAATQLIQTSNSADIFDIQNTNSGFGVVIKDMTLQYAKMTPSGTLVAVNLTYCENVRCERVFFVNCPTSFQTDVHCLQCGLFECTISYDLKTGGDEPLPVNSQTMVYLNGSNDFVTGCIISQTPYSQSGPSDCTGIEMGDNNAQRYITDSHISDFQTCLSISINVSVVGIYCVNTGFYAYGNAVVIQPETDAGTINDVHFTGCKFTVSGSGDYPGKTSGVVISTAGGPSINVSGIYFTNCSAYGFGNSGIEIDSGQNIVITGGQYSSNGQDPAESYNAAGIAVLGGEDITIVGVDCSGENGFWQQPAQGGTAQPYGICIAGEWLCTPFLIQKVKLG